MTGLVRRLPAAACSPSSITSSKIRPGFQQPEFARGQLLVRNYQPRVIATRATTYQSSGGSLPPPNGDDVVVTAQHNPEDAGCNLENAGSPTWWRQLAATTVVSAAALTLGVGAFTFAHMPVLAPARAASSAVEVGHKPAEVTGGGVASALEDQIKLLDRQVEARLSSAVGAVASGLTFGGAPASSAEEAAAVEASARQLIEEVWEVVDQNYLDARKTGFDHGRWATLRDEALARSYTSMDAAARAVSDMLARGVEDPYCRFIRASELAAMSKYDVSGVGLNLGTALEFSSKTGLPLPADRTAESKGVFVVGFSQGSPADKAAVQQGDEVVAVDNTTTGGLSPFQVSSLIQQKGTTAGASGAARPPSASTATPSVVSLKLRGSDGKERTVDLQRPTSKPATPVPSPVQYSLDKNKVGRLRLTSFNARSQRDLAAAVQDLAGRGATSYVLDLRDNRGGLVSEGLEVAALFLDAGSPIVMTESRAIPRDAPRAQGPALTQAPLLVLVNGYTASASEIVAGALHDNCRAVLAGSRTYGKGVIQSVYELHDGSGLVLTVGKYLTPRRTDIDRFGIQPDFERLPTAKQAAATIAACRNQPLAVS